MNEKQLAEEIIGLLDHRDRIIHITDRIRQAGFANRCGEKVNEFDLRDSIIELNDLIIKKTNFLILPKHKQ